MPDFSYTQFADFPFRYLNPDSEYDSVGYSKWNWTLLRGYVTLITQALGPHVIAGFSVTSDGSNVSIGTSGVANLGIATKDSANFLLSSSGAQTIPLTQFVEGNNYVYSLMTATSPQDFTWQPFRSISATAPPGGLLLAKVTIASGLVTAIDHTVSPPPTLLARLPWAHDNFHQTYDDPTSLSSYLAALVARIEVLEAGGGGGGGGGTDYLTTVPHSPIDPTMSDVWVQGLVNTGDAATLAAALAADGAATTLEQENWDVDAVQQMRTKVDLCNVYPEMGEDLWRAYVLKPGLVGHLYLGDPDGIIDEEHSDMEAVDFTNHRIGLPS